MTKAELIKALEQYDDDVQVCVRGSPYITGDIGTDYEYAECEWTPVTYVEGYRYLPIPSTDNKPHKLVSVVLETY